MKLQIDRSKSFEYVNLLFATLVIFLPVYFFIIHYGEYNTDYIGHIRFAENILDNIQSVPKVVLAHGSWQWLVILVHLIIKQSWKTSALIVTISSVLFTNGVLFWFLRKKLNAFLAGALSTGVLLLAPILFLDPNNGYFEFMMNGYIGTNTYHNPTSLLAKPLIILQFYFSVEAVKGIKSDWKRILLVAICSMLAVYTKPNYALCLLPAICIIGLIKNLKKHSVDWKMAILGIVVPSVAVLLGQWLVVYGSTEKGSIIFAPFIVMQQYSSDLLLKLLLSMLFPLVVTIFCFKDAIKDFRIQLGWLGFAFGTFYTYFLAETSTQIYAANFIWCAELSLFILFISCVLFLIDQKFDRLNLLSRWMILVSGFLHLACGIFYYFYMFFSYDLKYF